jgi:hypothetical protein
MLKRGQYGRYQQSFLSAIGQQTSLQVARRNRSKMVLDN